MQPSWREAIASKLEAIALRLEKEPFMKLKLTGVRSSESESGV